MPATASRDGFDWLIVDDSENSVFAWLRKAPGGNPVAVISNFTPVPRDNYRVPLPTAGRWREIINTDAADYGGSGKGNGGVRRGRRGGGRRGRDDAAAAAGDDHAGIRAGMSRPGRE